MNIITLFYTVKFSDLLTVNAIIGIILIFFNRFPVLIETILMVIKG